MPNLIEIIYPDHVSKEKKFLDSLSAYGIHHLDSVPSTGWNYALDHFWLSNQIGNFLGDRDKRNIVCLDVGCGNSKFHNFLEDKFGIFIFGIDRLNGFCKQEAQKNVNYVGDFLNFNGLLENSVDLIYWLSSIEHNNASTMRQLYEKSMRLLKPGGLFLATIALAERTSWFEKAEQTNLNLNDVQEIFGELDVVGDFSEAISQYQTDVLLLKQRYQNRYGNFDEGSPEYIVAGIRCVKETPVERIEDNGKKSLGVDLPITFVPSNDTHVQWMMPIASLAGPCQFMVFPERKENADTALQSAGHSYLQYTPGLFTVYGSSLVVLGNDWGKEEQEVIRECRLLSIPSICIQEGPLHFGPSRFYLQNADFAFLQGKVMQKYVGSQNAIVTGNPKYDRYHPLPLPTKPCVMINCNFTYGVYEEYRDQWLVDTIRACNELEVEYFVSQHPRDTGNLPQDYKVIKSNAFLVEEQIKQSTILISRFSTLIYEALLMGREVIYYDPMHESFLLIKENNNGAIRYGDEFSALKSALGQALINPIDDACLHEFLELHCNGRENRSVENCIREIQLLLKGFTDRRAGQRMDSDEPYRLLNYLIQNNHLAFSVDEVKILPNASLSPIIQDENITGFAEYLADRARTNAVVIEDLGVLGFNPRVPPDSIVLIPNGIRMLRDFPGLSKPLIELSKSEYKIVIVDDIDSFLEISEIEEISRTLELPLEFLGYNRDGYGIYRYISIFSNSLPGQTQATPDEFRVVAIISTFNEIDVIEPVIRHLANHKIDSYIIDNWSTDGTFEKIQQMQNMGILGIERWPSSGPIATYEWSGILKRKEQLTDEIKADWFIHHDADEIRESPWDKVNLRDAIYSVDLLGYNAIDFTVLDFQPVDNGYSPGSSLEDYFQYFRFGTQSADFLQVKAWKKTGEPIDLVGTAGHIADFPTKKIFPYKFLIKHYPIRSQEHGERKVLKERITRWSGFERRLGWHSQYDSYTTASRFLKNSKGLIPFNKSFYYEFLLERLSGIGILIGAQKDKNIELLDSRVQLLEHENATLINEVSNLANKVSDLSNEISNLSRELSNTEEEVISYAISTSWKLTRPLRILGKLLGR